MFGKKKEDKLVKGSEDASAILNTETSNDNLDSEILGVAFSQIPVTQEEKKPELGDFTTSTIGALSREPVKAKGEFSKREVTVKVGSKWQHFKGNIVNVKAIAIHTETLEKLVIYEHNNELWARPYDNFISNEDVSQRKDNKTQQKYRFEEINENE